MAETSAPSTSSSSSTSWLGRVSDTYNLLWKMVIRPPRDVYDMEELGPQKFRMGRRVYERQDVELQSHRGTLQCSHFVQSKSSVPARPCVVYLHGNCSSRLEAFDVLPVLLPRGFTVFCLDLSGSGRSDGEYISLGFHESRDLEVALRYLQSLPSVSRIGVWGRSMGATTSILRAGEDPSIAAVVLDSAFCNLRTVAEELVSRGRISIPQFLLNMAFEIIRQEVSSRAEFDPADLAPLDSAPRATCPAFFGVAADDTFVLPHHTRDLFNAWAGERVLRVFSGGHNGVRPAWFLEAAASFLVERLRDPSASDSLLLQRMPEEERSVLTLGKDGDGIRDDVIRVSISGAPELVAPWTMEGPADLRNVCKPARSSKVPGARAPPTYNGLGGSTHGLGPRDLLIEELTTMGFGQEVASRAAQRCQTVDEALDLLLRSDALCRLEESPPERQAEYLDEEFRIGPPGANLEEQLLLLGFDKTRSRNAARHCHSLDGAAEWLSQENATVTL
eukprot:TRINITY_DN18792_c0_g1_i1.p1 TRINITY_DN18792_c0_g1~~TRINITY_DN18792_c0_g1_i1.p1  ORF type:complete len:504 (-),score=89.96 TRINITY_DN18792_c0_g1_i1:138-1649(-)